MKRSGRLIGAVALAIISLQLVAPMTSAAAGDEASKPKLTEAEEMKILVVGGQASRAYCRTIMPERAADFDELDARGKAEMASSQDPDVKLVRDIMAAPDFQGLVAKALKDLVDDKEPSENFKSVICPLALELLNR